MTAALNTTRLYVSIAIVLLLYVAYCWYMYDPAFKFRTFTATSVETFQPVPTQPVPLMEMTAPTAHVPTPPTHHVSHTAPTGPTTTPVDRVPSVGMPPTRSREEKPFDAQEDTYESAQIPQRLRYPERSFSPGYVNDETGTAVASGVASYSAGVTKKAEQTFGPEFVQNGGQFMEGGITANDDSAAVSYSGF
jgi:hypothetical protein